MLNPTSLLEHFIVFVFLTVFRQLFNVFVFLSVFRWLFYCVLIPVRLLSIPRIILLLSSFLVPILIVGYRPTYSPNHTIHSYDQTGKIIVNLSNKKYKNNNNSTVRISQTRKTKHIQAKFFFIKDKVNSKEVKIVDCPARVMWEDVLTKPIQGTEFRKFGLSWWTAPWNIKTRKNLQWRNAKHWLTKHLNTMQSKQCRSVLGDILQLS